MAGHAMQQHAIGLAAVSLTGHLPPSVTGRPASSRPSAQAQQCWLAVSASGHRLGGRLALDSSSRAGYQACGLIDGMSCAERQPIVCGEAQQGVVKQLNQLAQQTATLL